MSPQTVKSRIAAGVAVDVRDREVGVAAEHLAQGREIGVGEQIAAVRGVLAHRRAVELRKPRL